MKKGFTLVELIVSMAIFLVVITIAVGAFVTVTKMKALSSIMKESQQKVRIASEIITRLARQGDKVIVRDGKSLEIYYNTGISTHFYGYKIEIKEGGDLSYQECPIGSAAIDVNNYTCNWSDITRSPSLSGGVLNFDVDQSGFIKTGTVPSVLNVNLFGKIVGVNDNPYYSNNFTIETAVVLEGLR